jgi:hypothetical protein
MWQFTKIYKYGGTTIHPGVVLKGDFIETDTTVSLKGSEVFSNIPKDILQPYTPTLPVTRKTRKK